MSSDYRNGKFAIFLPSFEKGGVERMMVNLARGFSSLGYYPDFVVKNAGENPYLSSLPETIRLVELDHLHNDLTRAATLYLERASLDAILSSKDENDDLAVKARELSGVDTSIIVRLPVHVTSRLKFKRRGPVKTFLTHMRMKKVLVKTDSLIAVSQGVADDIHKITGIPRERFHVIRNPVITPELEGLSSEPVKDDWFTQKDMPIVLGMGRLGRQKNFELLLDAFRLVRKETACRLVILGEGRRRFRLEKTIKNSGLEDCVRLLGFKANPFPYIARSDLFVLSSRWEGSPNALTEALALGIPVVSTDCESGPREILMDGKYGKLVPVNDPEKMADAIVDMISNPPPGSFLREAVGEYTMERAARAYLKVLLGKKSNTTADIHV